jgi:membrane protease YdiL (CAAX protease family)
MTSDPHGFNRANERRQSEELSAPESNPPQSNAAQSGSDRPETSGPDAEATRLSAETPGTDTSGATAPGTISETDVPPSALHPPEHMGPAADTIPSAAPWQAHYSPSEWQGRPIAIQPDLDVPWGAKEIALLVVYGVLLILVATLIISLALWAAGVTHEFGPRGPRETSIFLLVNQPILFAGILLYLYWRIHLRYGEPFWRTLQWKPLTPINMPPWAAYLSCIGGGCAMAVAVEAASQHLGKNVNMPIETFFKTRDTALILMVMSVVLAPLFEETVFRGFLYPVLARAWGMAGGIVATGIVFGLMHSQQLGGSKSHIALLILVGITLTWVRAGTRSVLASFLVHISYNGFLTAGFIASGAFRHLPPR